MSESELPGPGPAPTTGEAAPQRRPRRRRRGPARPQAEAPATSQAGEGAADPPGPAFGAFDSPPVATAPPAPTGSGEPTLLDRVKARVIRRPRRQSPSVTGEAQPVHAAATGEPAEAAEDGEQPSDEGGATLAPEGVGGRAARSKASPVAVNVVVPRGLGRRVNSKLIQQVAQLALKREGWEEPASLDVVIVSDEEMREINVTRRGIDEATDVLSFPMLEVRPEAGVAEDFFVLPPETQVHLGDVVISLTRVESQADEAGHSRERELAFLTVHAVLHILGYDHDTEEKRRRMRRREEDVLIELGLRRNGA